MTDYDLPMEEYHRAGLEITSGNPDVYKSLWSQVSARLDLAASNYRDGRDYEFESILTVVTPERAYTVEIERIGTRVGDPANTRRSPSGRRPYSVARTAHGK